MQATAKGANILRHDYPNMPPLSDSRPPPAPAMFTQLTALLLERSSDRVKEPSVDWSAAQAKPKVQQPSNASKLSVQGG